MDIFSQLVKLIFRIKYWLIILPLLSACIAIFVTRDMVRRYVVTTTIYTGIASGFTIESGPDNGSIDWNSVSNGVDNVVSIIRSKTTLKNVFLRLYAQSMIYGDPAKDNNYIKSKTFLAIYNITPREVRALIDKNSVDKTIDNLIKYETASNKNFIYGLFNWYDPHFSYSALSNIEVKRVSNSDMLQIQYTSDDPGIAYHTLAILNDEFVKQYKQLRFGETDNVVEYFRRELALLAVKLRSSEDSLTKFYIEKKVINYPEQTKIIAALSRDYDLLYNDAMLQYMSSKKIVDQLEEKIKDQAKLIENNSLFIQKLNTITELSTQVARLKTLHTDSSSRHTLNLEDHKKRLETAEEDLKSFSDAVSDNRYSKEGIATSSFVEQWVEELIKREKSIAELKVMDEVTKGLDARYAYFAPIGSILSRKEREINFAEQSYLALLESLNTALLRKKNLEMTSATLKAIDPPTFPLAAIATGRRMIIIATFIGTFFFVIGFFLLLEIFDRTIRDNKRAERLIPARVLGAFPKNNGLRRNFNNAYKLIATNYLANSIVPYLNPKEKPDIINFISTGKDSGKTFLTEQLTNYWVERGLRVKVLSWHEDIPSDTREYILSSNFSELYEYANEDIILVEHKPIPESSIPVGLLREASLNLVIVRADKVWTDVDKLAFERLKNQVQNTPLMLYLTNTSVDVAENFMGMMPPFTKFRVLAYKLMQFGLTSK